MKKILILGARGFIGRNLKEYFQKYPYSYDIYSPTKDELNILDEIAVKKYLKKGLFDVIIHAAICNPLRGHDSVIQSEIEQDLRGFYNFEKYNYLYGKMLYLGSGAEYDKSNDIQNVDEVTFSNGIPSSEYGFAKYIIGKSIESSVNIYNLRIFGLFGKYEDWKKTFISGACCKSIKGIPITIRQNVVFDYLYIDDFCRILHWFVDNKSQHKSYNITSGSKVDLLHIAENINQIGSQEVPIYICNEGFGKEYTGSNELLKSEIPNLQITPIEVSIGKLYEYYEGLGDKIDLLSLLYIK